MGAAVVDDLHHISLTSPVEDGRFPYKVEIEKKISVMCQLFREPGRRGGAVDNLSINVEILLNVV